MKRSPRTMGGMVAGLLFLAAVLPLSAQDDPEAEAEGAITADGEFLISWEGTPGRSFFLLHSADLLGWDYLPHIILGAGGRHELVTPVAGPFAAMKLRSTDRATNDPAADDFDGDWINNWEEITTFGTDPFEPETFGVLDRLYDGDGDGVPDFMAQHFGFGATPATDSDGDGLPDRAELGTTDPFDPDSDGDGLLDGEDPDPLTPLAAAGSPVSSLRILTPLEP